VSLAASPDDYQSPIGRIDPQISCKQPGNAVTQDPAVAERSCLAEFRDAVTRSGDALTFRLDDAQTKVVRSQSAECRKVPVGDCVVYRLVGFIPRARQYVLYTSYYESVFVGLLSRRTGVVTHLEGLPRLSPSAGRFATVAASDAWDIKSPIAIYANTDPPKLLWRFPQPAEYEEYAFDGWDGEDRVKLHTITMPQIDTDVSRTADGWLLRRPNGKTSSGTASLPSPQPARSQPR
jgi:hypothetical protein